MHKKQKEVVEYSVGLDIGSGSVGWAVIGNDYRLQRAKGKNLIGVRLFDSAVTAEKRRLFRGQRRRLSRRKWRIGLLNQLFSKELDQIDPNFLHRLKYSWVHPKDHNNTYYHSSLFDDETLEQKFYRQYPTIYHLRDVLVHDTKQHDLREVYLAIHHMIKYRGHFLREGEIKTDTVLNMQPLIEGLVRYLSLASWVDFDSDVIGQVDLDQLQNVLVDLKVNRSTRVENALQLFDGDKKLIKFLKQVFTGLVGNKLNLMTLFNLEKDQYTSDDQKKLGFKFGESDFDVKWDLILNLEWSDEQLILLSLLKSTYDGLLLKSLLGDASSVSQAMIQRFNHHHENLRLMKDVVRTAANRDAFDTNYDIFIHKNTNDKLMKLAVDSFTMQINDSTLSESQKAQLKLDLDNDELFPKQRVKDNGTIPYQLHLNELRQIIKNQSVYYPFLNDHFKTGINDGVENKIIQLLKFRVPYYVGPMVPKDKVVGDGSNHWLVKNPDKVNENIEPWNFNQVVDRDASGREFINRLTGTDTYLIGEPTLPKHALMYEKYNVLSELNNVRVNVNHRVERLDVQLKQELFESVFKTERRVTKKMVEDYLGKVYNRLVNLSGLSNPNAFNSALTSYHDLKDVLDPDFVDDINNQGVLEEIIELQTVFEDQVVLHRQLSKLNLSINETQLDQLSKKHYTGWGRLSKKLLTSHILDLSSVSSNIYYAKDLIQSNRHSVLESLYATPYNLMELMQNVKDMYGFRKWLVSQNDVDSSLSTYQKIDQLAGSPAIKRGIIQSFRILDDIKRAMGCAPKHVYLEFARETQPSHQSQSRYKRVEDLLKKAKLGDLLNRFNSENVETIKDDRLYLYYLQEGKDMYTGQPIDYDRLSSDYDIDHIVPRAYVKDDSLDNRVLVNRVSNARKSDSALYVPDLINQQKSWWFSLKQRGLMSDKKYRRLTRQKDFSEMEQERFIARSLVESRQIILNTANLIDQHFENDDLKHKIAVPVRAEITSDFRKYLDNKKNRDLNDYHHAHDAFMIATAGVYMQRRHFYQGGQVSDDAGNVYHRYAKDILRQKRFTTSSTSKRVHVYGFVVGSMSQGGKSCVDQSTGELVWTAADKEYMLKVLDYHKILVTRRVKDNTGLFYDQNIIAAGGANHKKPQLALSKKKNIDLYGGYNGVKNSFSAVIKTQKDQYKMISIPRHIANEWLNQTKKASEWFDMSYPNCVVLLRHVPYEQLMLKYNQDGSFSRVTIASASELHNAQQLVLVGESKKLLDRLHSKYNGLMDDEFIELFDVILDKISKFYRIKQIYVIYTLLNDHRDDFMKCTVQQKINLIDGLLIMLHANFLRMKPLYEYCVIPKNIKGSASEGRLSYRSGVLNENDILVYQSISGIFEKKLKIGLL